MISEQRVLNNGFVKLVEFLGGDAAVIRNARRCWRSVAKGEDADTKLIRHLLHAGHRSPFEAMVFTFDVKCPIFVARQWFRHRIGSYNEESLRYCAALRDYYVPDGLSEETGQQWRQQNDSAFQLYESLVNETGLKKEQARSLLPLGIYTNFFWTVNGSSLMNFLTLRLDKHAQAEIRQYAMTIQRMVEPLAPICFSEFGKTLQGITASDTEQD